MWRQWQRSIDAHSRADRNAHAEPNADNRVDYRERIGNAGSESASASLDPGSEWAPWCGDCNTKHQHQRADNLYRVDAGCDVLFPSDVQCNAATLTRSHAAPANKKLLRELLGRRTHL